MQDDVYAFACEHAQAGIGNVAFNEAVPAPPGFANDPPYLRKVRAAAGREIVDRRHELARLEQSLHEVRTDESGAASDEPATWLGLA